MIEARSATARWWVLGAATVGFTAAAFLVPRYAASALSHWSLPVCLIVTKPLRVPR